MDTPRSARPVGAVIAAAKILRHLSSAGRPLRVNEIARALDLYPGTCFQLLWTLVGEQLAIFDAASKTYAPGLGLLELSQGALKRVGIPDVARPEMRRFAARHDISLLLLHRIRENTLVVLEHSRSGSELDLHVMIGTPVSAWQGASGRLVASSTDLSDAELRSRFEQEKWQEPPAFEDWLADVKAAGKQGIAFDRGNRVRGVTSMAVAIRNGSHIGSLFLGTYCLAAQKTEAQLKEIATDLRGVADRIGTGLVHLNQQVLP